MRGLSKGRVSSYANFELGKMHGRQPLKDCVTLQEVVLPSSQLRSKYERFIKRESPMRISDGEYLQL